MTEPTNEGLDRPDEPHRHHYQADARATHQSGGQSLRLPVPSALWAAVAAVALAAVLVVAYGPAILVDTRQVALTPKDRLDAESDVRAALIQVIGGTILIGGLYYTARQFRLTREGQITERYAKSVALLGDAKPEVRIGAVYAFERIARDSPADRETVAELLSAFVREHTRRGVREPSNEKITADVQAALAALGRRRGVPNERRRLDLYCCGLSDADLSMGDWRQAMFYYSHLQDTSFTEAQLDEAGFSFCKGDGVALSEASARGARFLRASFRDSWFLATDLTGADFSGCDLTGSDFGGRDGKDGRVPCPPATLADAQMPGAILKGAILCGVDLSRVRGLQPDQLDEAMTDEQTIMPAQWGGAHFDPASSH
jgi:uncharacterized protein YjbI with pentapeptide repeats